MDPTREIDLVRQAAAGDEGALEALFPDDFIELLRRYTVARIRSGQDAEDLVGDALALVVRDIGCFRGDSAFRTWVHGYVDNKIREYRRRRGLAYNLLPNEDFDVVPATGLLYRDPLLIILERDGAQQIANAFRLLLPDEQMALRWYRCEQESARDVAARLGRTEDAVTSLVQRAVCKLRASLADYFPEHLSASAGQPTRRSDP